MNANRKTSKLYEYVVAVALLGILLVTLLQVTFPTGKAAPASSGSVATMRINLPGRFEWVCESPKFIDGRTQIINPMPTQGHGLMGVAFAGGCRGSAPVDPTPAIVPPVVTPQAPVCQALWLSTGDMYIGMPTGGGGVVTAMEGNWTIDVRGHVLMAKNGKSFTVTFPTTVMVQQVAILDNDPAMGASGWTLNGDALPTTGDHEWKALLDYNMVASSITFDKGQDSPHFGACILQ